MQRYQSRKLLLNLEHQFFQFMLLFPVFVGQHQLEFRKQQPEHNDYDMATMVNHRAFDLDMSDHCGRVAQRMHIFLERVIAR